MLKKGMMRIHDKNIDTDCCFQQANLQYLVELSPVILHLGEVGLRLLTRCVRFSLSSGILFQWATVLTSMESRFTAEFIQAYMLPIPC